MQAFRYRGTDSHGKRVQGQIDAANRDEAVRRLRQAAILPIDVAAGTDPSAPAGALKRTGKTRTAVTRAIGELAVLLGAGIPLERAMDAILAGSGPHVFLIELQRDPRRLSLTIDDASLSVAKQ